jgi:D-tyrosyl-tRNA(Tyr) deacylase
VVQRVSSAAVEVDGREVASIGEGILVYLGVERDDGERDVASLALKVAGLRIFEDGRGAMNRSVLEVGGEALVISQFTLLADARRGRRPSFTDAMEPVQAGRLYGRFLKALAGHGVPVSEGVFQAFMRVRSANEGPVTILLDSRKRF